LYNGIVTNISRNGMYIKTKESLPLTAEFNVLITFIEVPWNEIVLTVSVKKIRVDKADEQYNGMGVKVLDPPKKYLDIVDNTKTFRH
jgi:Tfp pilus assembly protein PilZ